MKSQSEGGFGLIEVVVAFFLLAIISVAILPALINGIRYSGDQSAVATATRQLNALVEQVREDSTCAGANGIAWARAAHTFTDGRGREITTSDTTNTSCSAGTAVRLTLDAKWAGTSTVLATVTAIVYVTP